MIETIILDYLNSKLDYMAYMEQPADKPERFYLIERTGGGRLNEISEASIVVQSYAPSLYEASMMNDALKQIMLDAIELDVISRVYLNSDYNFTDPATQQYRYQANFVVTYYEERNS